MVSSVFLAPLRGTFSPIRIFPLSGLPSLLVRFVRNTHQVCPLDLCCYRRLLVLPKDTMYNCWFAANQAKLYS